MNRIGPVRVTPFSNRQTTTTGTLLTESNVERPAVIRLHPEEELQTIWVRLEFQKLYW